MKLKQLFIKNIMNENKNHYIYINDIILCGIDKNPSQNAYNMK